MELGGKRLNLSRRAMLSGAAILAARPAGAAGLWRSALVMGTGRPGGYFALYGPEWGQLASRMAGVEIAYRASGGAAADILLIEQNAAQLGMTTLTVAQEALSGHGNWTAGVKFRAFRALFPMFPSALQIVSPHGTGIATLAGLADQIIGIGPDGGSGAAALPGILRAVGVLPKRLVTGDFDAQMHDMQAGKLAACAFIGAPPLPAIAEVALHSKLSLIGLSEAEAAQVARAAPGMNRMILKPGAFPGQEIAVGTVGTVDIAIAAAALPDKLAGALTLAALRNRKPLARIVPAAAGRPEIAPVVQAGIPFHPGAAAALRQVGLQVPDR
jgi:TRAP transporter TAXI family solute receptor